MNLNISIDDLISIGHQSLERLRGEERRARTTDVVGRPLGDVDLGELTLLAQGVISEPDFSDIEEIVTDEDDFI